MSLMRMTGSIAIVAALSLVVQRSEAAAPAPVATYLFNETLSAEEAGKPALTAINPLGSNAFESALVEGQNRRVYHWAGNAANPAQQGGLRLDATGLVPYHSYSIELVFEFLEESDAGWRRIADTQNRQSDNGFYLEPSNRLQVYPEVTGTTPFTTPGFHRVTLTNSTQNGAQEVRAYLDGHLEATSTTDQLNLDNANNPGHLLHFFVDNLAAPAQTEFAEGRIASLRLYAGAIVPEPVGLAAYAAAGAFMAARARGGRREGSPRRRKGDVSTCGDSIHWTNGVGYN